MVKYKRKKTKIKRTRRFLKNDTTIFVGILKRIKSHRGHVTVQQVAKDIGVSRQTIYNHHTGITRAIIDSENELLKAFSSGLDEQIKKLSVAVEDVNEQVFYAALIFMAHRKEIFRLICEDLNHQELLYRMVEVLYPRLQITWLPKNIPAPAASSERAGMFFRMIVEVFCRWGVTTHCDLNRAGEYISHLTRITTEVSRNTRI